MVQNSHFVAFGQDLEIRPGAHKGVPARVCTVLNGFKEEAGCVSIVPHEPLICHHWSKLIRHHAGVHWHEVVLLGQQLEQLEALFRWPV